MTGSAMEGPEVPPQPARPVASLPEAREVTRARARDLRTLLSKYVARHLPPVPKTTVATPEPPRVVGSYARLLPLLATTPWILGALFALSLVWDFPGTTVTVAGYTFALEGLLLTLSVSGLIGFITNWLAITMLFNPREARPIFGQGLVPAQRARVVYRMARAVADELINEKIIKEKIESSGVIPKYREMALSVTRGVLDDPDFRADLKALTADYVETVLASEPVRQKLAAFLVEKLESYAGPGLGGIALRAYRYVAEPDFQRRIDEAIRQLPGSLDPALEGLDHLLDRVPEKIEARSEEIEAWVTKIVLGFVEKLDVYDMVVTNMERYDDQRLEALIKNASNEQLNYIKYLGGVLGVLGGLFIWKPIASLFLFGTLGLLLYAIDEVLYRRRNRTAAGT
jgi:hypothetical protein